MIVLIFLVGSLLGLFVGVLMCNRFIRREVAGDIGPRLKQIQGELDTLQADVRLALATRYAELSAQLSQEPRAPL